MTIMPRRCPSLLLALTSIPSRIIAAAGAEGGRLKAAVNTEFHKLLHLPGSWSTLLSDDDDDDDDNDDLRPRNHHRRRLNVEVAECMDTSNWFGTRNTGGVNLFRTFYDCDCTGDLSSYYTFRCRLEDYCYVDEWNANATEICINQELTFDFSVHPSNSSSPGVIDKIEKGYHCVDYLKGGPSQPVCFVDTNVCALEMKDDHSFSTEMSVAICSDHFDPLDMDLPPETRRCPELLVELGYTEERARELCPAVTMGGTECREFGNRECRERTGETRDEMVIYSSTHDCSNVEPCATSMCQARKVVFPRPGKVHLYPECDGSSRDETSSSASPSFDPSGFPSTKPSANTGTSSPATGSPATGSPATDEATGTEEGPSSTCDDLDARARAVYDGTSCALVRAVIETGDVLAGTEPPACGDDPACVDGAMEVVERMVDRDCAVSGRGIVSLLRHEEYFGALAEFSCGEGDCRSLIRDAIDACPDGIRDGCLEAVPCPCIDGFLEVVDGLSEDFREDYIVPGKIDLVKGAQEKCSDDLSVVFNGSTVLRGIGASLIVAVVIAIGLLIDAAG